MIVHIGMLVCMMVNQVSLYACQYRQVNLYYVNYRQVSLYCGQYRHASLYYGKYGQVSPNGSRYRQVSLSGDRRDMLVCLMVNIDRLMLNIQNYLIRLGTFTYLYYPIPCPPTPRWVLLHFFHFLRPLICTCVLAYAQRRA